MVGSAAESTHWQTATDDFAERGQIGNDPEAGLGTAVGQAETGDDLIENQQGTVLLREIAQPLQEAFLRKDEAHVGGHGLHDDGRDFAALTGENLPAGLEIIIRGEQRVGDDSLGDTGCTGNGKSRHAGSGSSQERIRMAMVTADKLEDLVALRISPARRSALMVASVPELTMRTMSREGIAAQTSLASTTSSGQGAP